MSLDLRDAGAQSDDVPHTSMLSSFCCGVFGNLGAVTGVVGVLHESAVTPFHMLINPDFPGMQHYQKTLSSNLRLSRVFLTSRIWFLSRKEHGWSDKK